MRINPNSSDEEQDAADEGSPTCRSAGAIALAGIANGCKSCFKLRLKLESEERARVKAQEQIVRLRSESSRLRAQYEPIAGEPGLSPNAIDGDGAGGVDSSCGGTGSSAVGGCTGGYPIATQSPRATPQEAAARAAANAQIDLADADVSSKLLEGYRRQVELLQRSLRERDAREAGLQERQCRQKREHDIEKRKWEAQIATLMCDAQDLETRNCDLEKNLRAIQAADSSTKAASHGPASDLSSVDEASEVLDFYR